MAGAREGFVGGILGLRELIAEYPEAVEYDLISLGLRLRDLGTERLTWRDLKVIVTRMPPHKSAVALEQSPQDAPWGLAEHLLAELTDTQHLLLWSKTKDGQKNRDRPKPIERPGRRPEKFGKQPLPLDEMHEWLGW